MDIEEQLSNGIQPREVAKNLNISVDMVFCVEEDLWELDNNTNNQNYDQMD